MGSSLKVWQATVFLLSFLCMVSRHAALTGYFMVTYNQSKPYVQKDLGFSNAWLGLFDFSYLVCYALGNFVGGLLADNYPIRKVVSTTMLLFSLVYGAVFVM
jgi:sugar phosphate permease